MSLLTPMARRLPVERVALTVEQFDEAIATCASITDPDRQWQTYLQFLASAGLENWLAQRDAVLSERSRPLILNTVEQIRAIAVDETVLIPFATEMLYDPLLFVPEAIARLSAHHYVWVEVLEEVGDVLIRGYESAPYLQTLCTVTESLDRQPGYFISADAFWRDADALLMNLRSTAANWLPSTAASTTVSTESLSEPVINVWQWLTRTVEPIVDQIVDQIDESLNWIPLPPLTPAYGFRSVRSPLEDVTHAIAQLIEGGLDIPESASAAYRDLQWEGMTMRLYAIAWILPSNEWTLLIILSGQPSTALPPGISLQIQDEQTILEAPALTEPDQAYLYGQVVGEPTERFRVTIQLPDGSAMVLPPFTFDSSESSPDN